jgi:folate-dependent phosphoribosylglycinamide formyltransferase PurN
MRRWIAMFSHTGAEIVNISKALDRKPDLIITNKLPGDGTRHKDIKNLVYMQHKPDASHYEQYFEEDDLITLHGWMRIIPKKICKEYDIYNLHPGLITKHPELKGADPQSRVLNQAVQYSKIGCVLHRVIPEVDSGEVMMESSIDNHYYSTAAVSDALREVAYDMWCNFIPTVV